MPFWTLFQPLPCSHQGEVGSQCTGLLGRSASTVFTDMVTCMTLNVEPMARIQIHVQKNYFSQAFGVGLFMIRELGCLPAPSTRVPLSEDVLVSFRCFVCRQSRQQLEEEQKKSLYGLENTGNVS